ncbi:hypothetical protein BGZ83_011307 [Gryganskiella cystojenkinii]|nr:hypothetical protein BGZ83_011307 [Gryganskiella cystojenkinii]
MGHKDHKEKRSKKRKIKEEEASAAEDLTTGSFKKAMTTPSASLFQSNMDDFDVLGGIAGMDSDDNAADSSEDEAPPLPPQAQRKAQPIVLQSPGVTPSSAKPATSRLTQEQIMASIANLPVAEPT